jgi:hypothetical protein
MTSRTQRTIAATCTFLIAFAAHAVADPWNEKTVLNFSSPVMVPGATLTAGTYVFELVEPDSAQHVVQITREGDSKVITTAMAVPMKRASAAKDVIVQFSPTDQGAPPAIRGWFYPGSRYGHEFIYPDQQAKQIAERTKTVVLSTDVPASDAQRGVLRTYDASGTRADWRGDPAVLQEWEAWRKNRAAAGPAASVQQSSGSASAPLVRGDFEGTRVKLDDLETETGKYIGQTISVDGEVQDVLGPRLFTIDERNWGDLDGEVLVFVPTALAALINEDDQVTVTGTVRPFMKTEIEKEWGWFGLDPEIEVEVSAKPIVVATRVVGGNNNVALTIEAPAGGKPVGTTGAVNSGNPVSDSAMLATADEAFVGRQVDLAGLRVSHVAPTGGFFVESAGRHLFVLPADRSRTVRTGDRVTVDGFVLRMPSAMEERLKPPAQTNTDIYVFATEVGG